MERDDVPLFPQALTAFEEGRFTAADALLRAALNQAIDKALPCVMIREYTLVNQMMMHCVRLSAQQDAPDKLEQVLVAACATHRSLQPLHSVLVLKMAINAAGRVKNYGLAKRFCDRMRALLCLVAQPSLFEQMINTVEAKCQLRQWHDAVPLTYELARPHLVCPASLTPIFTDESHCTVQCARCQAHYGVQYAGEACRLCGTGTIRTMAVMGGPPVTAQSHLLDGDGWTQDEREIYDELASALGLRTTK